jgi:putative SOS response-associated peptidase YedK
MCGRYTLTNPDPTMLRIRFGLGESAELAEEPRFNIAPTDPVLAIRRSEDGAREPGRLRWGLLPGKWADERSGPPLINARVETIGSQPAFAESFRQRRCLVPADGFYEWRDDGERKQPVWMSRSDGDLFAFAGIWAELARADGDAVHSCAIVTCEPNELMRPIHDRMPVILGRGAEEAWLSPDAEESDLLGALRPAPDDELSVREVGDAVSYVREDGPHLIEPAQVADAPTLF